MFMMEDELGAVYIRLYHIVLQIFVVVCTLYYTVKLGYNKLGYNKTCIYNEVIWAVPFLSFLYISNLVTTNFSYNKLIMLVPRCLL